MGWPETPLVHAGDSYEDLVRKERVAREADRALQENKNGAWNGLASRKVDGSMVVDAVVTLSKLEYGDEGPFAITQVYRLSFENEADFHRWLNVAVTLNSERLVADHEENIGGTGERRPVVDTGDPW